MLFAEQANKKEFSILQSTSPLPFRLAENAQREVANALNNIAGLTLYERHMYFVDFGIFKQNQPVYINAIRDPLEKLISHYDFSRYICVRENRCHFSLEFVNETLDECVERRSPAECLEEPHGTSSAIPYFCGSHTECDTNHTFAMERAKWNVVNRYTVVGIIEELYNFLFVLERLLPHFFHNICLLFMEFGVRKENANVKLENANPPSQETKTLLRQALARDYEFYDFVKDRFHVQFQQVLKNV
jgi:dermatan/chondrotin sulfate uronyl 2-O-sulfotransferase UST